MSRQKNSFLINEQALNRETFPLTLPGYNRISTKNGWKSILLGTSTTSTKTGFSWKGLDYE